MTFSVKRTVLRMRTTRTDNVLPGVMLITRIFILLPRLRDCIYIYEIILLIFNDQKMGKE